MSDNDVETKEKNISGREAYYIFTVASIVTVFIYIFFIHYLPPSISFFNGAGRIAIICIGNGSIIWMGYSVFRPRQPLFVEEIIPGMILNRKGDQANDTTIFASRNPHTTSCDRVLLDA